MKILAEVRAKFDAWQKDPEFRKRWEAVQEARASGDPRKVDEAYANMRSLIGTPRPHHRRKKPS